MKPALTARDLVKDYGAEPVLRGVSLELAAGETAVLLGPSGSGKTTLLSILGGLLSPTSGALTIAETAVDFSRPSALDELRRTRLGFIFQHAQLLPFLSVEENLALVARNAGVPPAAVAPRIDDLIGRLDLGAQRHKRPGQLSGGQRQRVAIARALVHGPGVVLADEPTAALDWQHGEVVVQLLLAQARAAGAALMVVTHDTRLVPKFDRVFVMGGGRLAERSASEVHHAV